MENNNEKDALSVLISRNTNIVNFGSQKDAVSEEWIVKAEAIIRYPFSNSYKWFLLNFAGGEVGGEEIYSLYGIDFESISGGDIVAMHLLNLKNQSWKPFMVEVCSTDWGEVFCFDCSSAINGEYKILRYFGGESVLYAESFYQFLEKRIYEHGGS